MHSFFSTIFLFGSLHVIQIDRIPKRQDVAPVFTDLGGKHLYGKKGMPTKVSFLSSMNKRLFQWRQPKKSE